MSPHESHPLGLFSTWIDAFKNWNEGKPKPKQPITQEVLAGLLAKSAFVHGFTAAKEELLGNCKDVEGFTDVVSKVGEKEWKRVSLEWLILQMFAMTQVCRARGFSEEFLNRYHYYVYDELLGNGALARENLMEFQAKVRIRYESYYDAFNNEVGAGPPWHFGRVALRSIFGDAFGTDSTASIVLTWGIFYSILPPARKVIEAILRNFRVVEK